MSDQTITKRPINRIACIGEVMIELIAGQDGSAQLGVAGDTFNTAVYLKRELSEEDATVSYVTALGSDPYSDRIFKALETHNLDTSFVERRDGAMPGLYAIDTDDAGERSFSYWRSASAARTLFTAPCEITLERLEDFDLVFFSGISLAILPPDVRANLASAIDAFRARGGTFAYDSNHRSRLWESRDIAMKCNAEMWRRADIALPSVDDEMELYGDADRLSVRSRLAGYGTTSGAMKCGADGPMDLETGELMSPEGDPIKVIDSTSAGDSFNAAYLAAIVRGESSREAALAGHRLASRVVQHRGAIIPKGA